MLIAALSGRALAMAARRSGFLPLVADLFGDLDTRQAAESFELLPGGLAGGMEEMPLCTVLGRLADGRAPAGLVCGSGFERRPDLLSRVSERWPLIGNRPEVIERIKHPFRFASLCADLAIPHPEVSRSRPHDPSGWLAKRAGAAGGWHIRPAEDAVHRDCVYYQRRVDGQPRSALFLADGREARIIGFSRQWTDPAPERPFRYGGAVRLPGLAPELERSLTAAVEAIAAAAGLVGLNSADFIVSEERACLIEVNPRPGATLDVFRDRDGRLFRAHVKACRGELENVPLAFENAAAASAIVYGRRYVREIPALDWPDWAADRQSPGTSVAAGGPLCTVLAESDNPDAAVALVMERASAIRSMLEGVP